MNPYIVLYITVLLYYIPDIPEATSWKQRIHLKDDQNEQ